VVVATAASVSRLPDGGRFVALDAWRGLAALAVALRHINGPAPFLSGPLHDNLSMAVDFFFVLSGFVISAAYGERLQQRFSILRYMVLRIGRVWPLHVLVVACYLALELAYWWGGAGMLTGRAPFTGDRDPVTLPATLLLVQAFVYPAHPVWNVQAWSISVEIGLYLAAAWLWRATGRAASVIGLLAAVAALLVLEARVANEWSWVLRGIGGFGLGMACWAAWPQVETVRLPRWLVIGLEWALPLAALLAMQFVLHRLLVDLIFAALVLVFAREQGPVSRMLRTGPFVWLGVLSYSLYMDHGLVIGRGLDALAFAQQRVGARWVAAQIGGEDLLLLTSVPAALVTVAMLSLSLAVAWLAWRFAEWPARQWSRRQAARMGASREEAAAPTI
jgi:peptidoglycan/LPS O-acetylase OafA/YrhL